MNIDAGRVFAAEIEAVMMHSDHKQNEFINDEDVYLLCY